MAVSDWAETLCQILPWDGPSNRLMTSRKQFLGGPGRGIFYGSLVVIATPSYTKGWLGE